MGKKVETKINKFDGGIENDPRDPRENTCRMVSNFDILTNPRKMTPYRSSESGDGASATSQKQNFAIALRTGSTYSLYSLGVKSGAGTAEVLYKNITTGAANDLDDDDWANTNNNQSSAGAANFNLFLYYKKTDLIYGARAGTHIWTYDPDGSAWVDTSHALAYTNIAQGLIHSKDDIMYVPYDNKIAANDNTSWTDAALTLPTHLYITSICEYGNYLAIAAAPLKAGVGGHSVVYLWDRDSTLTTLSESIDWGAGTLKVLEEIDGFLVGISLFGGVTTTFNDKVIFRAYAGSKAIKFKELVATTSTTLPIAKQKENNRLYFMLGGTFAGAVREGVWSISRKAGGGFTLIHERTPNNNTALTSGILYNFFLLGDFMFISYNSSSAYALSKSDDQANYTASGIYETKRFDAGDASLKKDLIGGTVMTEFLPTNGKIILEYRIDQNTTWVNIFTEETNNSISFSAVNDLPTDYKEIQFRIESTGGAEVTSLSFKEEITGKRVYD